MKVFAYVSRIGSVNLDKSYSELDLTIVDNNIVRCPDDICSKKMINELKKVKQEGDTVGGEIVAVAQGVPAGWGEPVFNKLHGYW